MRYLPRLTELVENKIAAQLPDKISLIFDGWSFASTHYTAVFAAFPSDNSVGYTTRLLTISPLHDESSLNAEEHIEFLTYMLDVYNKNWENVCGLVGDNVSTNRRFSKKTGVPLVGFASHRLNLAIKDILKFHEVLLNKLNRLMSKLRNLLLSAKLRKLTTLRPKLRNVTRWSSTYDVLRRHKELKPFLSKIDSVEIDELELSLSETRQVDSLVKNLEVFESVSKELQRDGTSLSDVRAVFDALMDEYPNLSDRLKWNANIVHRPEFESALVKLQRGNYSSLSREEKNAADLLLLKRMKNYHFLPER